MASCGLLKIKCALAIFFALTLWASGHEWYPPSCCSGGDCEVLAEGRVKALDGGGYLVDERFRVERAEVRESLDGRFHGCFPTPDRMVCFFAPARTG